MFEEFIRSHFGDNGKYLLYAVMIHNDQLCIIPCRDGFTGICPVYADAVPISNSKKLYFNNEFEFDEGEPMRIDALILRKTYDGYVIDFARSTVNGLKLFTDEMY